MSYLANLTFRLAAGATAVSQPVRREHAGWLAGRQNGDGGFSGREGPSDVYYTGFALRGLALVGELSEDAAGAAAGYLRERLGRSMSAIEFLSLVSTAVLIEATGGPDIFAEAGLDRRKAVDETLAQYRRDDGGFAKSPRAGHSSTYHTFLASACLELVGVPLEDAGRTAKLVLSRQREDGGFVELGPLKQSGTNPTAAAVGLLRLLERMDERTSRRAADFLAGMQNAEGGLRANTRIPVADLLSTFTGLVALADLEKLDQVDLPGTQQYVRSLAQPGGGFRGGAWDDAADVEYTFYGLGTLALLAAETAA